MLLTVHLQHLEAEAIFIFREVVAECKRPVMLFSLGKDSCAMLHIAKKAFAPQMPPFPLLHIDTTWKFPEMYDFRDRLASTDGIELMVHVNEEGLHRGINPFSSGSNVHTNVMKTEALIQALDKHEFDAAIGGARRDEEKSRTKERIFSFRDKGHRWDPTRQRPEFWNLFNTRLGPNESLRVFPLSNWTELDVWQYILEEQIEVVPLYFAQERQVVERDGTLIVCADERMELNPGEQPMTRTVRFRTLGCYPLTGAIESSASTVQEVVAELKTAKNSERNARLIDFDQIGSMEKRKVEGYF
ncbi:MAG: sulfate adenylyltransferase subunit CysD [Gammaproteobacteria bacterium]|nr:sulfate adenylyltransferase subunit CysD [Gammaproteobacteria bacterium]